MTPRASILVLLTLLPVSALASSVQFGQKPVLQIVRDTPKSQRGGAYMGCRHAEKRISLDYQHRQNGESLSHAEQRTRKFWDNGHSSYWDRVFDAARVDLVFNSRNGPGSLKQTFDIVCNQTLELTP